MMILVDAWAWIALADRRDQFHKIATVKHQQFQALGMKYVITDYILNEVITYLYDALRASEAQAFVSKILAECSSGNYHLIHITPDQFQRAWQMRQKYSDKPDISFIDFTSMTVMQDLGILEVFTGDAHFQKVGLGFRLHP